MVTILVYSAVISALFPDLKAIIGAAIGLFVIGLAIYAALKAAASFIQRIYDYFWFNWSWGFFGRMVAVCILGLAAMAAGYRFGWAAASGVFSG